MSDSSAEVSAPFDPKLLALPWRKSEKRDWEAVDDYNVSAPGSFLYRHILDANSEVVAFAYAEGVHDESTKELNRRVALILAAGDMLAALKVLVLMARTSGGTAGRDDDLCTACDVAEAAIRKAQP